MQYFYFHLKSFFLLLLVTGIFLIKQNTQAQQMPQISQFMFNQLVYNPAAAGMHETQFNANVVGRFQWAGIDGSPMTNIFWTDYKFKGNKMAAGLNINYDTYGANKNTDVLANYAYYVPLSNKVSLSMGLRLGATFNSFNSSNLKNVFDQNDPVVNSSNRSNTLPKGGAGFQLNAKNFYLGISAPDLIVSDKNDIFRNKDKSFFNKGRNYLLMGGYKWKVNDSYNLLPNIRMSYFPGSGMRADLNLIAEITDYFWAGATFSTSKSYSIMAGTHISSRIRFGYAYEFKSKSQTSARLNGHEINLMINLDDLFRRNK